MDKTIMNLFWCKPVDVIAFLIIIAGFTLVAFGHNGTIKELLLAVTFYYFGVKTSLPHES